MTNKCYVCELLESSVVLDVSCGGCVPASAVCCCCWAVASVNICCCFTDWISTNVDIIFWLPTTNLPLQLSTQACWNKHSTIKSKSLPIYDWYFPVLWFKLYELIIVILAGTKGHYKITYKPQSWCNIVTNVPIV